MSNNSFSQGQVSIGDFLVGLIIITIAVILAMKLVFVLNNSSDFADVKKQAIITSQSLMSEGYPVDWNETFVLRPGILTDYKFNSTKWSVLQSMNYAKLRPLLAGSHEFYFYLINGGGVINISDCGVGSSSVIVGVNCTPDFSFINDKNIVRVERLVSYNNTIVSLVVIMW